MMLVYVVYEINLAIYVGKDFALGNSLFGAVKLNKYVDLDKYKYSGYGIAFDGRGYFSLSVSSGLCKNLIIFCVDMSSSVQIDNKEKRYFGFC